MKRLKWLERKSSYRGGIFGRKVTVNPPPKAAASGGHPPSLDILENDYAEYSITSFRQMSLSSSAAFPDSEVNVSTPSAKFPSLHRLGRHFSQLPLTR